MVTFDLFYDPDIENITEKYDAVNKYEYAITDDSIEGKMYMTWASLTDFTTSAHKVLELESVYYVFLFSSYSYEGGVVVMIVW